MGDIYVFDAFGTSHREQASTHSAILNSRNACAGLLLEKEIDALTKALNNSEPLHRSNRRLKSLN